MKRLLLHIALLLLAVNVHAQLEFEHAYRNGSYDNAEAVVQQHDGGYVIAGSTSSWGNGNSDAYLFKIDSVGNCLWSKAYGTGNVEWAQDIAVTPDSGLVVIGYTNGLGAGGYDLYLLRLDSLGNLLWDTTYGGSDWDFGYSIAVTADSGYIITGETYSFGQGNADGWVIKTDPQGNIEWEHTYGGALDDRLFDLDTLPGGDYALVGETRSVGAGDTDMWIMRLDPMGNIVWNTARGSQCWDQGVDIHLTYDGNLAIIGTHCEPDSTTQQWIQVIDPNSNLIWERISGGADNEYGAAIAEQEWPGLAIISVAQTYSFGGGAGDFNYQRRTPSGIYITGDTWGSGFMEHPKDVIRTADLGYIFVGVTEGFFPAYRDIYVIKMSNAGSIGAFQNGLTCSTNVGIDEASNPIANVSVYPNPFEQTARVDIAVSASAQLEEFEFVMLDMAGREVYRTLEYSTSFEISPGELEGGVYLYRVLVDGQLAAAGKLVSY